MRAVSEHPGVRAAGWLLFAAVLSSGAARAGTNAIETVLFSKGAGVATVEVRLACAHRYLRQAPEGAASRAEVFLERLAGCRDPQAAGVLREATRPAGRALADLAEIEYEVRDSTEARLSLQFGHPVQILVEQPGDPRSLRLLVTPVPLTGGAAAPELEPTQSEPVATPLPRTPERLAHAEALARARIAQAVPAAAAAGEVYAINLTSSRAPLNPAALGDVAAPGQHAYVTDADSAGETWHQLRLGFFPSADAAEAAADALRTRYPDAWVVRVSAEERNGVVGDTLPQDNPAGSDIATGEADGTVSEAELAGLMTEARAAFLARDFARTVQLCTKLLADPTHAYAREAQELLGIARERNGQFAHAVAEYRRYLERYPDGEGAERVRQRLSALTTIKDSPKPPMGTAASRAAAHRWDAYGGFAQYYRRDSYDFAGQGTTVTQSSLLSDGDFVLRRRGDRVDFSSRATLGHLWDLLGGEDGPGDQGRIYNLYVDLTDRQWDTSARLGRQSLRSGGVLGRFDGAHLSWQMQPALRLNFMTGYPVYLPSDSPDASRVFYAIASDFLGVLPGTDASLFYNRQEVDGIEDREAIGGEIRFLDESHSLIAMVDYDVGYSALNSFMALGNWTLENGVNLSATVDYRHSPFLTTENALIGQPVSSIDDLLRNLTEEEIRQLAADRSAEMRTYGLGASAPLSERLQVSADMTVTQLDGTPASGGVPGYPDLGTEYYYYVSLIGTSLWKEGDVSILGFRYTDGDTAKTSTLFVDTRYPLTDRLRINPRLALSLRDLAGADAEQRLARPALRVFYRMARRWQLELDLGGEWGSRESTNGNTDTSGWYVYGGYRTDF